MDGKIIVKSLSALAHESRLQIFRALIVAGPRGMTPTLLAEVVPIPAATLSFHLKELCNAGLVNSTRESRNLFYRADYGHMNGVLAYLTENCCAGQGCSDEVPPSCEC